MQSRTKALAKSFLSTRVCGSIRETTTSTHNKILGVSISTSFDLNNKFIYNDINCSVEDDDVYAGHDYSVVVRSARSAKSGRGKINVSSAFLMAFSHRHCLHHHHNHTRARWDASYPLLLYIYLNSTYNVGIYLYIYFLLFRSRHVTQTYIHLKLYTYTYEYKRRWTDVREPPPSPLHTTPSRQTG